MWNIILFKSTKLNLGLLLKPAIIMSIWETGHISSFYDKMVLQS